VRVGQLPRPESCAKIHNVKQVSAWINRSLEGAGVMMLANATNSQSNSMISWTALVNASGYCRSWP
jgi:hypothetical protein